MRYVVFLDDCDILRVAAWDVPLLTHDKFCVEHSIPFSSVSSSGCILFSRKDNQWRIYDEASWKTPPHDLTYENAQVLEQIKKRFNGDEKYKDKLSKEWDKRLERINRHRSKKINSVSTEQKVLKNNLSR